MKDEALKLALEDYLIREMPAGTVIGDPKWWAGKIATAIKQALALDKKAENARELGLDYEPPCKTGSQCTSKCEQCAVQEPVAYAVYHRMGGGKSLHWREQHSPDGDASEYQLVPLYTTPLAAQRQWVGLTEDERDHIWNNSSGDVLKALEAKLKEKNT